MLTEKLQKAMNDQIVAELWSANLYLAMSFYLKREGFDGCAHWLNKQAQEEYAHACEFADFMIKRGGIPEVGHIEEVPQGWGSVQEVFEHVYNHECHVSKLIDSLVDIASAEKDKATQDFLWGFVREQVEEEATAAGIMEKVKKGGDAAVFFIDSQLGQRK